MSTPSDPAPASLATVAQRFVASADVSYDERTDLIQNLRTTAAELDRAEREVREAPGGYRVADEEAGQ